MCHALGNAHGGSDDEERPAGVMGGHDLGRTDGKLSMVSLQDARLHVRLYVPTELRTDRRIETAVHDPKAVGRADHGVRVEGEEVAVVDVHRLERRESFGPGARQWRPVVSEDQ